MYEWTCGKTDHFAPDHDKVIEKAREKGISVQDMIALMKL